MDILIGVALALGVGLFASVTGLDRDRALYPVVTVVIVSYYALFAVMAASTSALLAESLVAGGFLAAAVAGFRTSLWIVVAALAAHGVFDWAHDAFIRNPGVPAWWPGFCAAYDLAAAAWVAALLWRKKLQAVREPSWNT